jgi:hypothetical protein
MKLALSLAAAAVLAAAPALAAQAPAAAPAKTVVTTPTKTGGATTASKTTVKGGPVPRTAASLACSKQADAQNIHGKARHKMMSACKAAAKKG